MERALYDPDLGYYRGPTDRATRGGDFLTAPETHPIFGWTLARYLERVWSELGEPRPFDVVEFGAGSGTLALTILEGLRRHGRDDLLDAVRYAPVETNRHRLADLAARFDEAGLSERLDAGSLAAGDSPTSSAGGTSSAGRKPVAGVLIANEFLDALPVHRVVVRDGVLRELFVSWRDDPVPGFVQVIGEPSTPELAARLAEDGVALAEGQVAEICLELGPWLDDCAARLERGLVLILDYGFDGGGTLRAAPPRGNAARLSGPSRGGGSTDRSRFGRSHRPRGLQRRCSPGGEARVPDRLAGHAIRVPRRRGARSRVAGIP